MRAAAGAGDPWFPFTRPRPDARVRLFCFPHAGGGASVFRRWQDVLPATVEVRAVQPPGRETRIRERPHDRVAALVEDLLPHLEALLDRPYALFGHSLGALVAFATARALAGAGRTAPLHLFPSAVGAPHVRRPEPVSELPDDAFRAELVRLAGTPAAVLANEELMRLFVPLLRADFAASDTYTCAVEPRLAVPFTVFGGLADDVPRAHLEAWGDLTTAPVRVCMVPGGHFFLEPSLAEVAAAVADALAHAVQ